MAIFNEMEEKLAKHVRAMEKEVEIEAEHTGDIYNTSDTSLRTTEIILQYQGLAEQIIDRKYEITVLEEQVKHREQTIWDDPEFLEEYTTVKERERQIKIQKYKSKTMLAHLNALLQKLQLYNEIQRKIIQLRLEQYRKSANNEFENLENEHDKKFMIKHSSGYIRD